ncbi:helix-turn-helix domain-containing protein [Marinobacter xestospongiae]|uniref:Helix-turn-helix transcriptional regulator n=1 Tax=Marinobacter xestospongiae TaxID=994319 RepID=A0ABU3VU37_9GAMM|nr:helix-turn-helix transcriptional regulator [Marinobacter xestospongiae]MDV2077787.1 helix-turn-helix transcriptional regulator [Marinobacter xestospongiae]
MLTEKSLSIAKKLILSESQNNGPKSIENTIATLGDFLSCQEICAFDIKDLESLKNEKIEGRHLEITPYEKANIKDLLPEGSKKSLRTNITETCSNSFMKLLNEITRHGSACTSEIFDKGIHAVTVVRREDQEWAYAKKMALTFYTPKTICRQKLLLLEALLPLLSDSLHRYLFLDSPLPVLTNREQQILNMIAVGKKSFIVACELKITERTVNFHLGKIYRKLGARNRQQAVHIALKEGVIEQPKTKVHQLNESNIKRITGGFSSSFFSGEKERTKIPCGIGHHFGGLP